MVEENCNIAVQKDFDPIINYYIYFIACCETECNMMKTN